MEKGIEPIRVDRHQCLLTIEEALVDRVDGEPDGRLRRPLRCPALEHVQVAVLDGELDVLHLLVVALQGPKDLHQFGVGVGHHLFHFGDVARGAHAGDDVFSLGIDEEVARRLRGAGDLVARKGDPGGRALAPVAEDHLLDVDRGSPLIGDVVDPAVLDSPLPRPGVEHRLDRLTQLDLGVLGKVIARVFAIDPLEIVDKRGELLDGELGVLLDPGGALALGDRPLELLPAHALRDVREHLDEPPVGVPGEAGIAGRIGEPLHRAVVEAEIEDRVEHPRHRLAGARADRDEQRIVWIAEHLPDLLLEVGERHGDLFPEPLGKLVPTLHVGGAGLGRDRETGGHPVGPEHPGHLGEARALATEKLPLFARAFREPVDQLRASLHLHRGER